jgi:hypothetical protein
MPGGRGAKHLGASVASEPAGGEAPQEAVFVNNEELPTAEKFNFLLSS